VGKIQKFHVNNKFLCKWYRKLLLRGDGGVGREGRGGG
jgi:hypothetical protein